MANLYPGVPVPIKQDDPTSMAFGKGMAVGLENYINQRMKEKEAQREFEKSLEKNYRQEINKMAAKVATGEYNINAVAQPSMPSNLDLQRNVPSQIPQMPNIVPTTNFTEALQARQGQLSAMPQPKYTEQPALPTMLPEESEGQIKGNVLEGLMKRGELIPGYGEKYNITKPSKNEINEVFNHNARTGKYTDALGREVTKVPDGAIIRELSTNRAVALYGGKTLSELNSMIDDVRSKVKLLAPNYPYYTPEDKKDEVTALFEELGGLEELRREKTGNKVTPPKIKVGDILTIGGKKYKITKVDPTGGNDHDVIPQ